MPVGVVKSKKDEEAWEMAKKQALKKVDKDDKGYWRYVMGIYKNATGRDECTEAMIWAVNEGANPEHLVGQLCEVISGEVGSVEVPDEEVYRRYGIKRGSRVAFKSGSADPVKHAHTGVATSFWRIDHPRADQGIYCSYKSDLYKTSSSSPMDDFIPGKAFD
jgi:hypothetical protein